MDIIQTIYKNQILEAYLSVEGGLSFYKMRPTYSKEQYDKAKSLPLERTITDGIDMVKETNQNGIEYHTIDHRTQKGIHRTAIVKNGIREIKIPHEELRVSDKVEDAELPRNYATDVAYNHFKNSEFPLASSETHSRLGHQSFLRLANRAMDEGHYAYHVKCGTYKELSREELSPNIALGKGNEYFSEHLLLSKSRLSKDGSKE